jgi:hypothetical protein
MSRRGLGAEQSNKPRDWEKFWGTVWYNFFHALGLIAIVVVILFIAGGILWDIFRPRQPSPPSHTPAANSGPTESMREAMQANFNKVLLPTPSPAQ